MFSFELMFVWDLDEIHNFTDNYTKLKVITKDTKHNSVDN